MSSLHQSNVVDLESADRNGGGGAGGGGGSAEVAAERGVDAPPSYNGDEIVNVKGKDERRESNVSDCSVEILDLESGVDESTLHLARNVKDCRICHLSMDATNQDSGIPIELGCSCKDDLAAAHKQCAEAWFKIKGNKICEICGSMAQNVVGISEAELMEQWNEANDAAATATTRAPLIESRNFWQGHRFLNFLLACMVFAFVISWLFHFNVPS
ncbi:RING/FYVE/PHD zinc finger superfamily protein [Perilla frutescens var. frutescens]|nr:RING/FYVE/PHD zinc finger superfamily protein [Perilla frutescens var. frutescens]